MSIHWSKDSDHTCLDKVEDQRSCKLHVPTVQSQRSVYGAILGIIHSCLADTTAASAHSPKQLRSKKPLKAGPLGLCCKESLAPSLCVGHLLHQLEAGRYRIDRGFIVP